MPIRWVETHMIVLSSSGKAKGLGVRSFGYMLHLSWLTPYVDPSNDKGMSACTSVQLIRTTTRLVTQQSDIGAAN